MTIYNSRLGHKDLSVDVEHMADVPLNDVTRPRRSPIVVISSYVKPNNIKIVKTVLTTFLVIEILIAFVAIASVDVEWRTQTVTNGNGSQYAYSIDSYLDEEDRKTVTISVVLMLIAIFGLIGVRSESLAMNIFMVLVKIPIALAFLTSNSWNEFFDVQTKKELKDTDGEDCDGLLLIGCFNVIVICFFTHFAFLIKAKQMQR